MKFLTAFTLVIFFVIQVSLDARRRDFIPDDTDPVPSSCFATDEILQTSCCILPPFYAGDIGLKCGGKPILRNFVVERNATIAVRAGLDCNGWKCILEKYHLLENGHLVEQKFYRHLDRWVKLNPEFRESVFKAKLNCKETFAIVMPIKDCPVIYNTTACRNQQEFYNRCREYFVRK